MKKLLNGIASVLCVMSVCVFAGCSSPSGGSTPPSDPQGTKVIAGWMDQTTGNLMLDDDTGTGTKVEIAKTSEVVAVPKGQQAAIAVESSNANGELFTTSRKVKLSSFVMSQYPVTRALFKAVMGETYYSSLGDQATANGTPDENPVTKTSWFDAIIFCNKLSAMYGLAPVYSYQINGVAVTDPGQWITGLGAVPTSSSDTNYSTWKDGVKIDLTKNGYRLPTEAEWEFCARGGDPEKADWKYTYSGSNTCSDVAWCIGTRTAEGTNIVGGMSKVNRLGLYDMSGNVFEWCDDYNNSSVSVDDDKYKDNEDYVVDPLVESPSSSRGLRGGSWCYDYSLCGCGCRRCAGPYNRNSANGFRLVRSIN